MQAITYTCALTYEARRWGIGLDVLLGVALNHIPKTPHVTGVEDVEGLAGMEFTVLHIRAKQVVVWAGVPLRRREGTLDFYFLTWNDSVSPNITIVDLSGKIKPTNWMCFQSLILGISFLCSSIQPKVWRAFWNNTTFWKAKLYSVCSRRSVVLKHQTAK